MITDALVIAVAKASEKDGNLPCDFATLVFLADGAVNEMRNRGMTDAAIAKEMEVTL